MTSAGAGTGTYRDDSPWRYEAREPGARRRKLAGYLKAANELRQTYQQNYMQSWNDGYGSEDRDPIPGAFPSTRSGATARSGEEEMILFPSYARKHVKQKPSAVPGTIQESTESGRDVRDTAGTGDAEYWRTQWEQYEDDNAIVDVDVRGWIYTPHKGPLNRRNRLFVGLARQMVGISAPTNSPPVSASSSRSSSPHPIRKRMEAHNAKHEEELVAKEAESLMRQGEAEADAAFQGEYSESPARDSNGSHVHRLGHSSSYLEDSKLNPVEKRESWNAPAQMSQAELVEANTRLMSRLKPFLANPLANTPISAFFYNDTNSRQKTIDTDAYGHFNLRAALDFVPTHVRILASDKLSATEEVQITDSNGVSIISDIDDTVKHSAIASGAREIFRNVFIRDLGDLSIQGVKEWYSQLAQKGVVFHYVSNSPWQLYPLLSSFFSMGGLPRGSFHLKQYSGMFQGIFEPVAERKKGTLERILHDFPERKFVLIGDSGEADLEVYTDLVLENPGRILGVYIRDVTTPQRTKFFDSSMSSSSSDRPPKPPRPASNVRSYGHSDLKQGVSDEDDPDLKAGIAASLKDTEQSESTNSHAQTSTDEAKQEQRPALPPRRATEPALEEEDLIDLASDDETTSVPLNDSGKDGTTESAKVAPVRPPKPRMLSSNSIHDPQQHSIPRKAAPPLPRKPSTSVHPNVKSNTNSTPASSTETSSSTAPGKEKPPRPIPPPKRFLRTVYDNLPTSSNYLPGAENSQAQEVKRSSNSSSLQESTKSTSQTATLDRSKSQPEKATTRRKEQPPPLPARLPISSYPAAAAKYASSLYNTATAAAGSSSSLPQTSNSSPSNAAAQQSWNNSRSNANSNSSSPSTHTLIHPNTFPLGLTSSQGQGTPTQANKKEELWKRRWARAEAILTPKGVVLRSWRVGSDVADDAMKLVERAQKDAIVAGDL